MISQILITFVSFFALMFISTNLMGMLVRQVFFISEMKKIIAKGNSSFEKVVANFYNPSQEKRIAMIFGVLIIIFLSILYYFWNIGLVVLVILIMVSMGSHLFWDIKYGGVGGSREVKADALTRQNATNGKYFAAQNGYGLTENEIDFKSDKNGKLFSRVNLADAVIISAEKNGIDTLNPSEASILGEFVVAKTREGRWSSRRLRSSKMPVIYQITSLLLWATLPILWYALYQL